MQQIGRSQSGGFVRQTLLVDQKRKTDSRFFAKELGIVRISQADRCQRRPRFFEFLLVFAQLRNMLAAEESTVMAKENQHRRTPFPKRPKPHFISGCIR